MAKKHRVNWTGQVFDFCLEATIYVSWICGELMRKQMERSTKKLLKYNIRFVCFYVNLIFGRVYIG